MLYRDIFKILGIYLLAFAGMMLIPLALAAYYQFYADPSIHPQPHSTAAFGIACGFCLALAGLFLWSGWYGTGHLFRKEGVAVVVLIWLITPVVAASPFFFSKTLTDPFQAYFEAASALTTTGSTVIQAKAYDEVTGKEIPIKTRFWDTQETTYTFYGNVAPVRDPITHKVLYEGIEAVSKAVLFWRSFLQWLGGAGIVVLFVAIFPVLGISGKLLFQSEITGPLKDATTPRVASAAVQLWAIYCLLTFLQVVVLIATNHKMEWLDAVTVAFSTLSTGGLSIHNTNIAYYQNSHTEWVVIIFMILGGVNFSLYYQAMLGRFYRIYQPEFFLYLTLLLLGSVLTAWYLVGTQSTGLTGETGVFNWEQSIRYGTFQIVSAMTSTGFVITDYDAWPYVAQFLLIVLMFAGGMSGSTSGGMKVVRVYILFLLARFKVESLFRVGTVRQLKVHGQEIDNSTAILVLTFFLLVISSAAAGIFLYLVDGIDSETALGLVGSMLNNSGMAFRAAGPTQSFAFMSDFSLSLSSFLMILGRLEYYVVLAVLVPAFWRQTT